MRRTTIFMRSITVTILVIVLSCPTAGWAGSHVPQGAPSGKAEQAWSFEWPTENPEIRGFLEVLIIEAIDNLHGKPFGFGSDFEFSLEIPGYTFGLAFTLVCVEDGKYLRFQLSFDGKAYDEEDADSVILDGPLTTLATLLRPSELIAYVTGFDCGLCVCASGEMEMLWDREVGVWEYPDYKITFEIYYLVTANLLKLFAYHVFNLVGFAAYEFVNIITLGALDRIAHGSACIGAAFTYEKEGSVIRRTVAPIITLDIDISIGDTGPGVIEFDCGVTCQGQVQREWLADYTETWSSDISIGAYFRYQTPIGNGDHQFTLYSDYDGGDLTDSMTRLLGLQVAGGTNECREGDVVSLAVRLTDSANQPVPGQTVHFERKSDGTWSEIASAVTGEDGFCHTAWTCTLPEGTYDLRARYDGLSGTYDPSVTGSTALRVKQNLAEIQVRELRFGTSNDYLVVRPGDTIHIGTYVADMANQGVVGLPIDFFLSSGDRLSWTKIGTDITEGWGYASVDWVVPPDLPSGNHYFRAAFGGDGTYEPAVSDGEIQLVIESVKFTSPADGATVGTATPTFQIDISQGVSYTQVAFRIDSNSPVYRPWGTTQWISYALSEGAHMVSVLLYSGTEVRGVDYLDIVVDAYHPLSILFPEEEGYVQAGFEVRWQWSGSTPYEKVELLVDGLVSYPYLFSEVVGLFVPEAGQHVLTLRATVGSSTETASHMFIVDRNQPSVTIISPTTGTEFGYHGISVSWNASDDNALDRYEISIDGSLVSTIDNPSTMSASLNVPSGPHRLEVRAYDLAGYSTTSSVDVRVRTPEACLVITSPGDDTVIGSNTIELYWAWWSTSSLVRFEVLIDGVYNTTVTTLNAFVRVDTGMHTIEVRGYIADESYDQDSILVEIDPTVAVVAQWDTGIYVKDPPGMTYSPYTRHYACALDFCGDARSEIIVAWLEYNPGSDYIIHMKMFTIGGVELFHWTMLSDDNINSERERIDDIAVVQLDGDTKDEFVVSTIYGLTAFDSSGSPPYYTELWTYTDWGYIHTLAAEDIDEDGYDEVWSGGAALLLDHDGSVLWSYNTVSGNFHTWFSWDPTESKFAELDGDPQTEVLLSGFGNLLAGNHDGSDLWLYDYCYATYYDVGEAHYDVGNADSDSLDEILVYNWCRNRLTLLDSDTSTIWDVLLPNRVYDGVLRDLDGDGVCEILLLLGDADDVNNFTIMDADGTLMLTRTLEPTDRSPYAWWSGIQLANVDNDPETELILPHADRALVMSLDGVTELEADCMSTYWLPRSSFPVDHDGDGMYELGVWFGPPFIVFRITHDLLPPVVEISDPIDGSVVAASFVLSWSASDNKGVVLSEVWINGTKVDETTGNSVAVTLGEGGYLIDVRCYDERGNMGSHSIEITVDATPPSIDITSPQQAFNSSSSQVSLQWISEGQECVAIMMGGCEMTRSFVDHATVELPVGSYNLTCRAYDEAGNYADDWVLVTVDTNAPVVLISYPADNALIGRNSTEVTWLVVDHGTGVLETLVYVNGDLIGEHNLSAMLTDLVDGVNNVTILSVDYAGNSGSDYVLLRVDLVKPLLRVLSPLNTVYHENSISSSAELSDTFGIARAQVILDGIHTIVLDFVRSDGAFEYWASSLNSSMLADGDHVFTFLAYDRVGHINSTSVVVETVRDTMDPTVDILSPADGVETSNSTVVLVWYADDDHGVSSCRVLVNGEVEQEDAVHECTLNLDEGVNLVSVVATDFAGHTASEEIHVVVDHTAPVVTIGSPSNGAQVSGSVVVEVTVVESNTVTHVDFFIDGLFIGNDTVAPWMHQFDAEALSNGDHILEVRAYDRAGNVGSSESTFHTGVMTTTTTTPIVTSTTTTTVTPGDLDNLVHDLLGFLFSPLGMVASAALLIVIVGLRRRRAN